MKNNEEDNACHVQRQAVEFLAANHCSLCRVDCAGREPGSCNLMLSPNRPVTVGNVIVARPKMDVGELEEGPLQFFISSVHTVLSSRRLHPFPPSSLVPNVSKVSLRCTPLFSPLPSFSLSLPPSPGLTSMSLLSSSLRSAILTRILLFQSQIAHFVSSGPQCQPANLTWAKTDGPYNLIIVASDKPCGDALYVTPVLLASDSLPT